MKEKVADITFFAMVRNTCTESEMPPRLSEFYEGSGPNPCNDPSDKKSNSPIEPYKGQTQVRKTVQEMSKYDLVKQSGNMPRPLAVYTPNYGIRRDRMTLYIYLHGT